MAVQTFAIHAFALHGCCDFWSFFND